MNPAVTTVTAEKRFGFWEATWTTSRGSGTVRALTREDAVEKAEREARA